MKLRQYTKCERNILQITVLLIFMLVAIGISYVMLDFFVSMLQEKVSSIEIFGYVL